MELEWFAVVLIVVAYVHWRAVRPVSPADLDACESHKRVRHDDGTPINGR